MKCEVTPCLCCVCLLRESSEFGAAFTPEDECCDGCHGDMAADGWPGNRCGSDPEPQPSDGPEYHAEHQFWRDRQACKTRVTPPVLTGEDGTTQEELDDESGELP